MYKFLSMITMGIIPGTLLMLIAYAVMSPPYMKISPFLCVMCGILINGVLSMIAMGMKDSRDWRSSIPWTGAVVLSTFLTCFGHYTVTRPTVEQIKSMMWKHKKQAEGRWCQMVNSNAKSTHSLATCPIERIPPDVREEALKGLDAILTHPPYGEEFARFKQTHMLFKKWGITSWTPNTIEYFKKVVVDQYRYCDGQCAPQILGGLSKIPGTDFLQNQYKANITAKVFQTPKEVLNTTDMAAYLNAVDVWKSNLDIAQFTTPTPTNQAQLEALRHAVHIAKRSVYYPAAALGADATYFDALSSRSNFQQRILEKTPDHEIRVIYGVQGDPLAVAHVWGGKLSGVGLLSTTSNEILEQILGPPVQGSWGDVPKQAQRQAQQDVRSHQKFMRRYEAFVRKRLGSGHDKGKDPYANYHANLVYDYGTLSSSHSKDVDTLGLIQRNVLRADQDYFKSSKHLPKDSRSWPVMLPINTPSASSSSSVYNGGAEESSGGSGSAGSFRSSSSSSSSGFGGRSGSSSGGYSSGKN